MSMAHVPLFLTTRDVPPLLATAPPSVQESVVADLELLQGGLLQPILRVRDGALARLLLTEARGDHRALRQDQRRRMVRWLGEERVSSLLHEARAHARTIAGRPGTRAVLGSAGTHALLRYSAFTISARATTDTAEHDAADLDLALLGLGCVAHRLHLHVTPERLQWFCGLAHEALDRLRAPTERRPSDAVSVAGVADPSGPPWESVAGLRACLPPSWLAPLPLIEPEPC